MSWETGEGQIPRVKTISINFSSSKVGDVTLTILHEVCHVALAGTTHEEHKKEHVFIYGVEYSYMFALNDFGVQFSHGDIRKGEHNFWLHLDALLKIFDPNRKHRVPLSEILEKWERWRNVK